MHILRNVSNLYGQACIKHIREESNAIIVLCGLMRDFYMLKRAQGQDNIGCNQSVRFAER